MKATLKSYPSNLTTAQWALISPYIPDEKSGGRPRSTDIFLVVQAIVYVLCSGCSWRMLPGDFPKWQTVYHYFRQWRISGLWERLNRILRGQLRLSLKRCTTPSAAIVDSQSVEIGILTANACGIDGGKRVKGRKRHVLVDTLGFVIFVVVTAANVSDYSGARRLLQKVDKTAFPRLFLFWADGGYRADSFIRWVMDTFRWIWLVTLRPDKTKGFVVVPKRWVVERTFGWFHWCRRLSKDYEALPETAEAFIYLAMIRIMLRRLA